MKVYSTGTQGRNRSGRPTDASQGVSSRIGVWQAIPLRTTAFVLLLALGLQFLLGMLTNLYVQVPSAHPGAQAANYFGGVVQGVLWALAHSDVWLRLHVILGILVFLGALLLLARAISLRNRAWIILTALGLASIIGAGFNGASFMNYGHDFSSLIMSATFLLALVVYLIGLYIGE